MQLKHTSYALATAALLWFLMFSPWTAGMFNFWYAMTASGMLLTSLALLWGTEWKTRLHFNFREIMAGIVIAAVLWGVFWLGDKVSQLIFSFARVQVDTIYEMKGSMNPALITVLLVFVIGPAEEIFWRGFIQTSLMEKFGKNAGFILATLAYTLIHVWSFNPMLILAALAAGSIWGLLYRLFPQSLTALIISHALWDAAAFVLFPF